MGGKTFENTITLSSDEYSKLIKSITLPIKTIYLLPFRLGNKQTYSDIDFITPYPQAIIEEIMQIQNIVDTKTINLCKNTQGFNTDQYSVHLLTNQNLQIDVLKSFNDNSLEITRAYYSYCFANVYFKQYINLAGRNYSLSHLGLICSSNKIIFPLNLNYKQINKTTRIVWDCCYIFNLMDLDYESFTKGFADEFELLKYLKTSKYYSETIFISNSKFNHDIKRLIPFKNLHNNKMLNYNYK